ncbi:MAG: tetratricopeptide repeat protein [Opitutales bacterium]|nr:tetratricopeptide repeat protein [Opitutales bacterium]
MISRVYAALFLFVLFCCVARAEPEFASVDEQLTYFAGLAETELAQYDIAYLNLVCAQGLKGSENLDIPACLARLDQMAKEIGVKIEAGKSTYERDPASFENSLGHFKAISMVTYAVRDYGVMYNPARIETPNSLSSDDVFFADSKDVFINGLLQGEQPTGTCSSLPVYWIALGRRMGCPLRMSNTLLHFFVRWDGDGDRFNFEGSQNGCGIYDDQHYREWPVRVDEAKVEYLGLLESFTRKEELMHFLIERGNCLKANGRDEEARSTYRLALTCYPNNFAKTYLYLNRDFMKEKK